MCLSSVYKANTTGKYRYIDIEMSIGSSRHLIRSLEQEISRPLPSSDPTAGGEPLQIRDTLRLSIEEYLRKHSTLESINSTRLSNELFRVYQEYVTVDLEKEPVFILALTSLISVLTDKVEFKLWIEKYLRPTIDPAGIEKSFVSLTTQLIENALVPVQPLQDSKLAADYRERSIIVLNLLVDEYLKQVSDDTQLSKTQESEERFRFKRENITIILQNYCNKEFKSLCFVMNEFLSKRRDKHAELLCLLSSIIKYQPSQLHTITETPLLQGLIDFMISHTSHYLVASAVSIICMILPHICNSLAEILPKLFAIHIRLVLSENEVISTIYDYEGTHFETTESGPETMDEKDNQKITQITDHDGQLFDLSFLKLCKYLYGLYPLTFIDMMSNPTESLKRHNIYPSLSIDERKLKEKTFITLKSFKLHPNFLEYTGSEAEIKDTSRFTVMGSPNEIASFCLSSLVNEPTILEPEKDVNLRLPTVSATPASHSDTLLGTSFSTINFKSPNFTNDGSGTSRDSSLKTCDESVEPSCTATASFTTNIGASSPRNVQEDLLDFRRQLFSKTPDAKPYDIGRRHSFWSTPDSFTLNSATRDNVGAEAGLADSMIDFYQRELMILGNYLDFAEYTRDISLSENKRLEEKLREQVGRAQQTESMKQEIEHLKREIRVYHDDERHIEDKDTLLLLESCRKFSLESQNLKNSLHIINERLDLEKAQKDEIEQKLKTKEALVVQLSNSKYMLEKENDSLSSRRNKFPVQESSAKSITRSAVSEKEKALLNLSEQVQRIKLQHEKEMKLVADSYRSDIFLLERKIKELEMDSNKSSSDILAHIMAANELKIKDFERIVNDLKLELNNKDHRIRELSTTRPISIPDTAAIESHAHRSYTKPPELGYPHLSRSDLLKPGKTSWANQGSFTNGTKSPIPEPFKFQKEASASYSNLPALASGNTSPGSAPISIKGRGGIQKKSKLKM